MGHGARADPHWRDLVLFHEYFHGDTGRGLGASHQTGWTALALPCIEDVARLRGGTNHGGESAVDRSAVSQSDGAKRAAGDHGRR
jgi:hypothetical protein